MNPLVVNLITGILGKLLKPLGILLAALFIKNEGKKEAVAEGKKTVVEESKKSQKNLNDVRVLPSNDVDSIVFDD